MVLLILVFLIGPAWLVGNLDAATGCLLLDHPVEDEVVLVTNAVEQILEQLSQVSEIRFLLELERAAVVHINCKLLREALAEGLDGGRELLITDLLILVLLGFSGEALPRQAAFVEVHEDEANGLQVISAGLLYRWRLNKMIKFL